MNFLFRLKIFLIIIAALWITVYLLNRRFNLKSLGITLSPGVLLWKTKRGLQMLDKIVEKGRRFWKAYGYLSMTVGIALMGVFFTLLALGTLEFIVRALNPNIATFIPSAAKTRAVPIPGLNIPLVLGLIAFATVMISHELSHGILFRSLGYRVKSAGLGLFLAIPGAFVEQDEEEFEKASPLDRIRMTSAGPVANILLGLLTFGLLVALVSPSPGVPIVNVKENTPAARADLPSGTTIKSVQGNEIFNHKDLNESLRETEPGDTIDITTSEEKYTVTLGSHPENENLSYLGVEHSYGPVHESKLIRPLNLLIGMPYGVILGRPTINKAVYNSAAPWFLIDMLNWIFSLSMLVALFNLLPLKPLDGGHILEGIANKFASKPNAEYITKSIGIFTLVLFLLNILLVFAFA